MFVFLSHHLLSRKFLRFLVSGSIAAGTDFAFLYFFTDILHIWYLTSAVLAFLIAFWVSFTLQKLWTFKNRETRNIGSQMMKYFALGLFNLSLNTLIMYVLVDFIDIYYMLAQVFAAGIVGIQSFFISKFFIFKKSEQIEIAK